VRKAAGTCVVRTTLSIFAGAVERSRKKKEKTMGTASLKEKSECKTSF
jgi:hypothetical protein